MKEIFIYNFNFVIAKENKQQIGTVSINKDGELKISPSILKAFTDEEVAEIARRALNAYSILLTGKVDADLFSFTLRKSFDRHSIIYKVKGKKKFIGFLLDKNQHLVFEQDVPSYIRLLCVQSLKEQNVRFYYNGKFYN